MGKVLVIKGADFSNNAVSQVLVLTDEVRALFAGHNVGEKGMLAFQRFINTIGGLNGSLWGRIGKMYVPMLFESDSIASNTFFDVKNNEIVEVQPSNYVTYSYSNNCLTIATTAERTSIYPITIGKDEEIASLFGIVDSKFELVGYSIQLEHGSGPRWNRGNDVTWMITPGKTVSASNKELKIAAFGDAVNNSEISHAFITSSGSVDYETPSQITGQNSGTRNPTVLIYPNGEYISLMVIGYVVGGLTKVELETITAALYQMQIDINN